MFITTIIGCKDHTDKWRSSPRQLSNSYIPATLLKNFKYKQLQLQVQHSKHSNTANFGQGKKHKLTSAIVRKQDAIACQHASLLASNGCPPAQGRQALHNPKLPTK
jgi:hypothetical protein